MTFVTFGINFTIWMTIRVILFLNMISPVMMYLLSLLWEQAYYLFHN